MEKIKEKQRTKSIMFSMECSNNCRKYVSGDSVNEIVNVLASTRDIPFINCFIKEYINILTPEQLQKLLDIVVYSLKVEDISFFKDIILKKDFGDAEFKERNFTKLEEAIISTQNAEYMYYFARDVNDVDITKLEEAIILTQNAEYIYYFARDIKDADIAKLEEAIISTQNVKYMYYFADIKDADIAKLEEAIILTRNAEYVYYFARDIKDANIAKLEEAIILTRNAEFIYYFAKGIKDADIAKLEEAIISTQDGFYICHFAELVEVDIKAMWKKIKNTKCKKVFRKKIGLWKIYFS